jgi:hypothetical protein
MQRGFSWQLYLDFMLVAIALLEAVEAQVVLLLADLAVHIGPGSREGRLFGAAHAQPRSYYQQVVEQQEPGKEHTEHQKVN